MHYLIMLLHIILIAIVRVTESAIKDEIQTALTLGNSSVNYNREECLWRANNDINACPDPDVHFILYDKSGRGEEVDIKQADWLRHSAWDPLLDSVLLIHGYAGGDNVFPMSMLRDAYIRNGSYNVFVVDWGGLAPLPCYPAAVHNMKTAARCSAVLLTMLRDANPGDTATTTCVGHSLGAHVCGLVSNYLFFRMHRIIGLDPARPLIRNNIRLRPGSAENVQVIHTNAGVYGDSGKLGKVDFCLNGGKAQPYCEILEKPDLCSHVMAICFMAASLDGSTPRAHPCPRRCPSGSRPTHRLGVPVAIGENTPKGASGFYCMSSKTPPYCAKEPGDVGHPWCCMDERALQQTLEVPPLLTDTAADDEPATQRMSPNFIFYNK